jgi:hypothetical protein
MSCEARERSAGTADGRMIGREKNAIKAQKYRSCGK